MACVMACRERKTWKGFFIDLLHPLRRWGLRYKDTRREYYQDLIYYPIMRRICKVFGHIPVYWDEKDPECNIVICKRCNECLDR